MVPVVVTDRSGDSLTGLERGDFSVFENGAPQKIVAFSRPALSTAGTQNLLAREPAAGALKAALAVDPKRTYLISVFTLHFAFNHFAQDRRALQKFFMDEAPGDSQYILVALGRQQHVIVDSTRDPGVILAAITSKALLKTIQDSEAANVAFEMDRFGALVGQWCGNCECTRALMDMNHPMCRALKAQVQAALFSFSERASMLNRTFLEQVLEAVRAMASVPTTRTVVFISDGV